MRVALYARVSTVDRDQTPETQLCELRAWATAQGGIEVREYVDQMSGAKANRPALTACLAAAHRREFDECWIWALDRLSREGIAPVLAYLEQFRVAGVRVRSLRESWLDTDAPTTPLLISVMAWVASMERERIRERVMAGLERVKRTGTRSGKPVGRPPNGLSAVEVAAHLKRTNVSETARHFDVSRATIRAVRASRPELFA